ncbi:MAG: hypothetical protein JXC32_19580, partial [Anaerolineae bacterium]|nr:hypothetical protein [Anaerolineae bacterium]
MDWKTFLANLIRSLILIAAAVVLFLWVLGRDRDARAPGSVTGFQWRQRQVEEARPTVPTEPRFEFVPPADRTPRPFPAPDQAERRPVVTEAYDRLGAAEYHAAGYLGQGVTVAVVDTQFDGLENAISAGEIPATVTARRLMPDGELVDSLQSGDGPHGTACAEIIHDLAPGAQLYLLQVDSFLVTAERMFEILEQAGVRVVSLSISVLAMGRADGTGVLGDPPVPIYDILRDAYENKDMLIVMSAGNYARQHYAGPFRDLDNDGIHEVLSHTRRGSTESVTVAAEEDSAFFVHLSWDDWGPDPMAPSATSDYDLYVYDEADNLVASSTVTQ